MCSISYRYLLPILMFIKKCSKGFSVSLKQNLLFQVGGATSLLNTQDESALIRWETCGPEVARIVSDFEDSLYDQDASSSAAKHHEDNEKFRQKFSRDV